MANSFEAIKPDLVTCADGCHLVDRFYVKDGKSVSVKKPCDWMQVSKSSAGVSKIIYCDEEGAPTDENGNYLQCGMPRNLP